MPHAILGISAYYHDSAAALLVDGEVVAAAQEERFSRKRHDAGFPLQACRYVLQESGLDYDALSSVAFYDKPFLKFERLLETYHGFAPRGVRRIRSMRCRLRLMRVSPWTRVPSASTASRLTFAAVEG